MTIICDSTGCMRKTPAHFYATVSYSDQTKRVSSDCSKNLLYLTDDAGFADLTADTPDTTPYFNSATSAGSRLSIFDSNTVDKHFKPCSRTSQELSYFFSVGATVGTRPQSITVGFRDAGETWIDAYERIRACFPCFRHVTHVSHDINDAAFHDLPEQKDLAAHAIANNVVPYLPTHDAVLPADYSETASMPSQVKIGSWWWMVQKDQCTFGCKDDNGADVIKPWYQPDHLIAAAKYASYGFSDARYDMQDFMQVGEYPGLMIPDFTVAEIINITGVDPQTGIIADATRHVNVITMSQFNAVGYVEGLTANGYCVSSVLAKFAIVNDVLANVLGKLHGNLYQIDPQTEAGLQVIQTSVVSRIRTYINKRLFSDKPAQIIQDNIDDYPEYKWSNRYPEEDIFAGGDGHSWVAVQQNPADISAEDIAAGNFPLVEICFAKGCGGKRPRINICRVLRPSEG